MRFETEVNSTIRVTRTNGRLFLQEQTMGERRMLFSPMVRISEKKLIELRQQFPMKKEDVTTEVLKRVNALIDDKTLSPIERVKKGTEIINESKGSLSKEAKGFFEWLIVSWNKDLKVK